MSTTDNHYPTPGTKPEFHPYANLFPLLDKDRLGEMADDIKAHGQREAIVLFEGKVLDGRNRLEACFAKKVEPFYRFFDPRNDGKSALEFVISRNLRRRHLTTSQAAIVAAEALPLFEAEAKVRQSAGGKAKAGNLKAPAATPAPPAAGPPEPASLPQEPELKHGAPALDFDRAMDVLDTDGVVSASILKARFSWTHAQAVRVIDALKTSGKVQSVPATPNKFAPVPDEFDQRPQPFASTSVSGKPKKPSKTMAGALATSGLGGGKTMAPEPKARSAKGKKPAAAAPAPAPAHTTASDAAGAAVGVSGRSVRAAKALMKADPAKAAEVKAGTKKLAAAVKEAAGEAPDVQAAIGRIRQVCGKALADAVQEGTRLKKKGEVVEYAALPDDEMLRLRALIDQGWELARAKKYKAGALARTHRIGDLLDRAAAQGGTFSLEIDGWTVSVTKQPAAQ